LIPTDRFVTEIAIRVRYAETDAMGIVHHASYIIYFEEGRTGYSRERGHDYAAFEQSGLYLTVTEVNARYLKPAKYDQLLTLYCWITTMKSRSLLFNYEIVNAESGDLLVTGFSKHFCITHEGRVARLPETWRAWANT